MENQEINTKENVVTKATLIRYLVLFSFGSILLSILLGAFFGGLSGALVNRIMPGTAGNSIKGSTTQVQYEDSAVIDAVKKANPAVVSIIISKKVPVINPLDPFGFLNGGSSSNGSSQQEVGGGSGFIISPDGYIVTNKHVASDASSTYTVIMSTGKRYDGKIVATDPTNDISLMKINESNLPSLSIADSSSIQLGQRVIAIGNALGQYQNTVSVGVVSGINRVVTASDPTGQTNETLHNVIQTDAQINPGNSGGPLLNLNGEVVGINTAVAQNAQGIGFAIPINQAKSDISSVEKGGKIVKPQLGVVYQPIDNSFSAAHPDLNLPYNYGAYISSGTNQSAVVSGSPADKAGLKAGDIILEIDGQKIDNTNNTLSSLIQNHSVGDTISIKYYSASDKIEKTVNVKLDKSF